MINIDSVRWCEEKNLILIRDRGVSFEDVILSIQNNKALAVESGSNNYPHQKLLIVEIRNYAYMVPMVISDSEVFFKTVIPSRKHTKRYCKE